MMSIFFLRTSTFFSILLLIFESNYSYSETVCEEECRTESCVKAAAQILDFVDLNEDPCRNFYKFACGSFIKNAVKKDFQSPFVAMEKLLENEMKGLVIDPIEEDDSNAQILMKKFYKACMDTNMIKADGDRTFMKAINELGGWPLINGTDWDKNGFDWAATYLKAKKIGLPVIGFFHFYKLYPEFVGVKGPNFIIEDFYTSDKFNAIMKRISEAFGAPERKQDYEEVYRFIKNLYKYRSELDVELNEDEVGKYQEIELEDHWTIANLTRICPNVPWLNILNSISGNSSQFDNSSIIFYDKDRMPKYCEKLDTLLKSTKPEVIANYYIWNIIHNSYKYMSKEVRVAFDANDDEKAGRFPVCYRSVLERFDNVVETVYIRRKTTPIVKSDISEMIQIIKDLFIQRLKTCDWMEDTSRTLAVRKTERIKSLVGAEDELYDIENFDIFLGLDGFNFTTDNIFEMYLEKLVKEDHSFFATLDEEPDEWRKYLKNLVQVNAFFYTWKNILIIPAPYLTSYVYNWNFPVSMNYGALGSTIGHEIMHGFNERAYFDKYDKRKIDWRTNATEKAYKEKVQCVIDEYERLHSLNGTQTLDDNVADIVGADIGYEAYQVWVKRHRTEKKLPGVPLTPEQIYWVQAASRVCYRHLDDKNLETDDEHGISIYRVEAPARHSKFFAEAFGCPTGSLMNPEKKCNILQS